uniref:Putative glycoprotein n=1 Tax=Guangdong chinese water snake torovirus TaxID=2116383 RepID=A0A2P1GNR0_9NIDO|nr:putative glycoprotein [Guangdong chinese water snake torovirus]
MILIFFLFPLAYANFKNHDVCGPGVLARVCQVGCHELADNWAYETSLLKDTGYCKLKVGIVNSTTPLEDIITSGYYFPIKLYNNNSQDLTGHLKSLTSLNFSNPQYQNTSGKCRIRYIQNITFNTDERTIFVPISEFANVTQPAQNKLTRLVTISDFALTHVDVYINTSTCNSSADNYQLFGYNVTNLFNLKKHSISSIRNDTEHYYISFLKNGLGVVLGWSLTGSGNQTYVVHNNCTHKLYGSLSQYIKYLTVPKHHISYNTARGVSTPYNQPLKAYQNCMLYKQKQIGYFRLLNAIMYYNASVNCPYTGGYGSYCPKETHRCFTNAYESYFGDIYKFYLLRAHSCISSYTTLPPPPGYLKCLQNFTSTWSLAGLPQYSVHSIDSCLHPILNNQVLNVILLSVITEQIKPDGFFQYLDKYTNGSALSYDLNDIYAKPADTTGYIPFVAYLLSWYQYLCDTSAFEQVYKFVDRVCNFQVEVKANHVYLPFCYILSGNLLAFSEWYNKREVPPEFLELLDSLAKLNTTNTNFTLCNATSNNLCLKSPFKIQAANYDVVRVSFFGATQMKIVIKSNHSIKGCQVDGDFCVYIADRSKLFILGTNYSLPHPTVVPSTTVPPTTGSTVPSTTIATPSQTCNYWPSIAVTISIMVVLFAVIRICGRVPNLVKQRIRHLMK